MSLSGGRESREIEDLKSKLVVKTDELNEAIKRNSEVCTQLYMYTPRDCVLTIAFRDS